MLKLTILISCIFAGIFLCKSKTNELSSFAMHEVPDKDTLQLSTFHEYPPEIESDCYSASFLNEQDRNNSNYLLYFGTRYYGEEAKSIIYLIINNRHEILRFDTAVENSNKSLGCVFYSNDTYSIELTTISRKQTGYESFRENDILKIFKQKKLMIELRVITETGC